MCRSDRKTAMMHLAVVKKKKKKHDDFFFFFFRQQGEVMKKTKKNQPPKKLQRQYISISMKKRDEFSRLNLPLQPTRIPRADTRAHAPPRRGRRQAAAPTRKESSLKRRCERKTTMNSLATKSSSLVRRNNVFRSLVRDCCIRRPRLRRV
jgi:hypothetical protein